MKFTSPLLLVALLLTAFSVEAQCPRERLSLINVEPQGPNPNDEIRIIVAKEYDNGCEGLQSKDIISIDQNTIQLRFDEFCFDRPTCTQAIHCDTAHYVIGALDIGRYTIEVLDGNMANDSCTPSQTVAVIGNLQFEVKDIRVNGQQFNAPTGSRQCIPYEVTGFDELTDMQMSFRWDSTKLRYDTIRYLYPLAFLSDFNINSPRANELRFIWTDDQVLGRNVPDGETLFEVCFNVIGNEGDTVILDFEDGPLTAEGTDLDGYSYGVMTTNSEIYINNNPYSACSTDKEELMCQDWLKDTITARYEEYCGDPEGSIVLELVDWRGYTVIALSLTKVVNGESVGVTEYYGCDGTTLGICTVGGSGDGTCSNVLLEKDVEPNQTIWNCSESLPGCYTVSQTDFSNVSGLLKFNIVQNQVEFTRVFEEVEILNQQGQRIRIIENSKTANLSGFAPGVYYVKSGSEVEKFVLIP